ncbi:MAG: hypothetical protein U0166_19850 [Acidobacteriota bacterium]
MPLLAVAAAGVVCAMTTASRIERVRPAGAKAHLIYLPSGPYLRYASTGFQRLVADGMYLWAIQYAGNDELKGQEQNLLKIFDAVTDLSPAFDDAYFNGAFIMATDGGRVADALALLDKGFRVTGRYEFPYDAAFYCVMYLRDFGRARDLFDRASKAPGCPEYVVRLALKMAAMVDPAEAYRLIRSEIVTFEQANPPAVLQGDPKRSKHRTFLYRRLHELEVLLETKELEVAMGRVAEMQGQAPGSIRELRVRVHELGIAVPALEPGNDPFLDPDGQLYTFADGKVKASSDLFVWVPVG